RSGGRLTGPDGARVWEVSDWVVSPKVLMA
ncbi:MAG: hypothetical protein QOH87_494, partial [Trebonia sp.]|nr:hypothetical protein [Trebonia sp.]